MRASYAIIGAAVMTAALIPASSAAALEAPEPQAPVFAAEAGPPVPHAFMGRPGWVEP